MTTFNSDVNFCPRCGAILPTLGATGSLVCVICKYEADIQALENYEVKYTVNFNTKTNYLEEQNLKKTQSQAEGPLVERKCPKCSNEKMYVDSFGMLNVQECFTKPAVLVDLFRSYSALQLRSADEGQTIFYTCTSCQFKETENS